MSTRHNSFSLTLSGAAAIGAVAGAGLGAVLGGGSGVGAGAVIGAGGAALYAYVLAKGVVSSGAVTFRRPHDCCGSRLRFDGWLLFLLLRRRDDVTRTAANRRGYGCHADDQRSGVQSMVRDGFHRDAGVLRPGNGLLVVASASSSRHVRARRGRSVSDGHAAGDRTVQRAEERRVGSDSADCHRRGGCLVSLSAGVDELEPCADGCGFCGGGST